MLISLIWLGPWTYSQITSRPLYSLGALHIFSLVSSWFQINTYACNHVSLNMLEPYICFPCPSVLLWLHQSHMTAKWQSCWFFIFMDIMKGHPRVYQRYSKQCAGNFWSKVQVKPCLPVFKARSSALGMPWEQAGQVKTEHAQIFSGSWAQSMNVIWKELFF